jgi:small-conductance mechanosensitive channel
MDHYLDPAFILSWITSLWQRIAKLATNTDTLLEILVVAAGLIAAHLLARPLINRLKRLLENREWRNRFQGRFIHAILPLVAVVFAVLFLRLGAGVFEKNKLPFLLIDTSARLLTAWFIIRFTTAMLRESNWARLLSIIAWLVAALYILKLLVPTIELLDQLAIDLGGVRVSLLLLIKGIFVFTVLLKIASSAAALLDKRIAYLENLTPSVQVLLSKALRITFLTIAVLVALSSLGINLSAFAFIGGAIGVGVGFGLQKVVSNLVSGVILLLDKSIKPGDVIEIGSTYGRIQSLGARYVSVATRDNTEYLIPNEDLITTQVVNWSFSDKLVRLKIVVGVSYDSDIHGVMKIMVDAAANAPRVNSHPKPVCQLKNFGDSAIDLELRLWISDPENGIANVSSTVRIAIWDAFKEHGVEIPFPQRDLHLRTQPALNPAVSSEKQSSQGKSKPLRPGDD